MKQDTVCGLEGTGTKAGLRKKSTKIGLVVSNPAKLIRFQDQAPVPLKLTMIFFLITFFKHSKEYTGIS